MTLEAWVIIGVASFLLGPQLFTTRNLSKRLERLAYGVDNISDRLAGVQARLKEPIAAHEDPHK